MPRPQDSTKKAEKLFYSTARSTIFAEQMETPDLRITSPAIGITARILFTLIFFLSGITHFTSMQSYIGLMPAPIPFRAFWVAISGVVELAGAAMILLNYRPRLGAWLIVIFLVPVTIVVHGTAMLTLPDPVMRAVNVSMFLKGIAMLACALFITQFGVSPADNR
jgi:putative oxidoreductase